MSAEGTADNNSHSDKWDVTFGLVLSIFAAILAINELGAGKFGDDEIQLGNEKTKSYMWYQSKSIKESLAKGQFDLLDLLGKTNSLSPDKSKEMAELKEKIKSEMVRYKKEKDEILKGSKAVGPENYAQDVDGKLGMVVGAKEIEDQQTILSQAGDKFDLGTLFLQISLVLGAIGLIAKSMRVKLYFLGGLILLGSVGAIYCTLAYRLAFTATG